MSEAAAERLLLHGALHGSVAVAWEGAGPRSVTPQRCRRWAAAVAVACVRGSRTPPTPLRHLATPCLARAGAGLSAALLLAAAGAAAAAAPVLTWGALAAGGTFNYQWTLEKTVQGTPAGQTADLRMTKGTVEELTYTVIATRSVAPTGAAVTLAGSLTISNPGGEPVTVTTLALSAAPGGGGGGGGAGLTATCGGGLPQALAPGASVTCTWPATAYPAYPTPGVVTADVGYTANATGPGAVTGVSPQFGFANVQGQYATALLMDKFDLGALEAMYQGFVGFDKVGATPS